MNKSNIISVLKKCNLDESTINTNHLLCNIQKEDLQDSIEVLLKEKVSFLTMFAIDERSLNKKYKLHLIFLILNTASLLTFKVCLDETKPSYPTISKLIPAAEWFEREIHDMFGIVAEGVDLLPLVLHGDFPHGKHFPMRKDFKLNTEIEISEVPHQFTQPHAEGMHQVAVGPIHAGIIEPGHLRFCTIGEQILDFNAQLFYTHKGIEKSAEGKTIEEGLILAEHVCGMCSYSHSTAYCQAVESLSKINIPKRATYIRTICLELERLNSHLADLSAICSASGFAIASMQAASFREKAMQITFNLTNHRFFRGLNTVGGLKRDINDDEFKSLKDELQNLKKEFKSLEKIIIDSDTLLDRLETTGELSFIQAKKFGIVGPAARASGIDIDLRRDFKYAGYHDFTPEINIETEGDALARTKVRVKDIYSIFDFIRKIIDKLPTGKIKEEIPELFSSMLEPGIGAVESAKGSLIHCLILDKKNKISRWHVRSASYMNWRGVIQATKGRNIVPDSPLVNKSFNLCYACVDR
jgi:Ni,Fe-hydrogenase III large subunit/Ni,Fe-hydrogenase III component G